MTVQDTKRSEIAFKALEALDGIIPQKGLPSYTTRERFPLQEARRIIDQARVDINATMADNDTEEEPSEHDRITLT